VLEGTNRDVDDEPGEIEMRREQGRTKKKRQDGALSLGLLRKSAKRFTRKLHLVWLVFSNLRRTQRKTE
jgi:hypothetical protein